MTSLALDYFYTGTTHKVANPFIDYVNSQELPRQYMGFSKSTLTAYKDGENQRTEEISVDGNSEHTISFGLQEGVTLHNTTTGATQTGTASIKGGERFYLSAPLSSGVNGSWVSEDIDNCVFKLSSIMWVSAANDVQDLAQSGDFIMDPGRTIKLSVNWLSLGGITIQKNNDNNEPLEGVKFKLWNDNGFEKTDVTNSAGQIIVEDMTPCTLKVQEIQAKDGYILDDTIHNVEIRAGVGARDNVKIINNSEPTGSITITKVNNNGDRVAQAEFEITADEDIYNAEGTELKYSRGDIVKRATTSSNGTIELSSLPLGSYLVREVRSSSWVLIKYGNKKNYFKLCG